MNINKIIIIDKLDENNLISSYIKKTCNAKIKYITKIEEIRLELENSEPEETLILLYGHYKFIESNTDALTFLCRDLRVLWERTEPVIVYSFLKKEQYFTHKLSKIFKEYAHYYLELPKGLLEIEQLIKKADNLSDGTLDNIKKHFRTYPSIISAYLHDFKNSLKSIEDLINTNIEYNDKKIEIFSISDILAKLIHQNLHNEFKINELINLVSNISSKEDIENILKIVNNYNILLRQHKQDIGNNL